MSGWFASAMLDIGGLSGCIAEGAAALVRIVTEFRVVEPLLIEYKIWTNRIYIKRLLIQY